MPKRRREDHSDNKAETITFSMSEDILDNTSSSYSTTMPKPTTTLSEQVFNVSEWTIETDRVSTSNPLFSSMTEPALSMSFSESDHNLHIPGAHHDYYDVVNVSNFQPPELPQPSQSANTESSKSSKERFFSLSL